MISIHETPHGTLTAQAWRQANERNASLGHHYTIQVTFGSAHPIYGHRPGAEAQTALTVNKIAYKGYKVYNLVPGAPYLAYSSSDTRRDDASDGGATSKASSVIYDLCQEIAEGIQNDPDRLRQADLDAVSDRIAALWQEIRDRHELIAKFEQMREAM